MWVLYSWIVGLSFGLGNTIFGISCTQRGIFGVSCTGPATLLYVTLSKLYTAYKVKAKTGKWMDKSDSNYYEAVNVQEEETNIASNDGQDDEFKDAADPV